MVFAAGFVADQWTKRWAIDALSDGTVINLFPTVSFRLVFNPGVSFGLGADLGPVLAIGLIAVTVALIVWAGWLISRGRGTLEVLLVTAVAAGASGNIYDRITRADNGPLSGHVVDFIAVDWFAIFNVADILTVCGVIAWMLVRVLAERKYTPSAVAEGDHGDSAVGGEPAADGGESTTPTDPTKPDAS